MIRELEETRRRLDASEQERKRLVELVLQARVEGSDPSIVRLRTEQAETLRLRLEEAWTRGDRNTVLSLLQEMGRLGEPAYPALRDAWTRISQDMRTGALSDAAYASCFHPDFLTWLLSRPEPDEPGSGRDPDGRGRAAYALKGVPDVCDRITADLILRARDKSTIIAMMEAVVMSPDPRAHAVFLPVALGHADPGMRKYAVSLLAQLKTPEAADALRRIGGESNDPDVRRAALDVPERK